ncbi:MAG: metalloprotease [Thermoplasmata archaeon]
MSSGRGYPYAYTPTQVGRAQPAMGQITTSSRELRDLSLAFVVLTLDILFVLLGGAAGLVGLGPPAVVLQFVAVAAAAALTGFVAHEMAHKFSAQRRGYWAEFRMSPTWLLLSLIVSAFAGFLFAAPGATVIGGMGSREDWGRTALAGPLTNMGFATAFYAGAVVLIDVGSLTAVVWLLFLAFINGWFATFNLIPFGPLDGRKVLSWNVGIWIGSIVLGGALAVLGGIAIYYGILPFNG